MYIWVGDVDNLEVLTQAASILANDSMNIQHNSIAPVTGLPPQTESQVSPTPSLVDLANQLSPVPSHESDSQPENQLRKPQVVFVEQQEDKKGKFTQIIEITIDGHSNSVATPEPAGSAGAVSQESQVPLVTRTENEREAEPELRFSVNPFDHEVDGSIPVMPTLPIADDAQQLTERVIARQTAGDHYAWRLVAITDLGPEDEDAASDAVAIERQEEDCNWTETEVVTQVEGDSNADCFYATPGQVISIDGNQGFDHIDLRSYSIDDATFQPGTIRLHSDVDRAGVIEGDQTPPISIRYRGVQFAIFKGEVRVEL